MEITIRIGGEAGQGLQLIGTVLTKIFARCGFQVFTHQDYMSRIRGGHNFYQITISSDRPVMAIRSTPDILLALNAETIAIHGKEVKEGGIVLYDPEAVGIAPDSRDFFAVPLLELCRKLDIAPIMSNSVAVGAVLNILGLELEYFPETITSVISKKSTQVIASNELAARAGHDFIKKNFQRHIPLPKRAGASAKLLINGNQAIGLGALVSGCKFYAAYPMTPSTGVMAFLASRAKKYGIVVEQAEDEIAAVNMAIGASFGGVRAMTGTSGGGFALMGEGLSLAGMTETPLVIAEVQRPGPATGLPTRTEQGDLFFILHAGHGEFPRVVFTPGTPEQAFRLTNKAFHLAEKYQIPVIIQSDQYLADSEWTYDGFESGELLYEDFRLRKEALSKIDSYKRYAFAANGISPLAIPGESKHLVVADSDEHDEDGHIIEDAETRIRMVNKRMSQKLKGLGRETIPPLLYGHNRAKILLVGYGSSYGFLKEAVDYFQDQSVAMLHFSQLCPFPDGVGDLDFATLVHNADVSICIEGNATGQFARLFRAETGLQLSGHIRKFDGRPFVLHEVIGEINDYLRRI